MIPNENECDAIRKYGILLFVGLLNFIALTSSVLSGYKIVPFFGLNVSASIYAFPISYACGDLIAEIYGYKLSRIYIWVTFISLILFSIFIKFLVSIEPVDTWHQQKVFAEAFSGIYRLTFVIIASLIIGDFINAYF